MRHRLAILPCAEPTSGMTRVPGGHYCHSCRTRVVDLSELSEAEIEDLTSKGPVCGEIAPRRARPAALAILAATVAACTPWGEDDWDPNDPESCPIVTPERRTAQPVVTREPGPTAETDVTVTGLVVDTAGSPLASAYIRVFANGSDEPIEGLTDARGRFRIDDLPAGKLAVYAQYQHGNAFRVLEVEPGETVHVKFELLNEAEYVRGGLG